MADPETPLTSSSGSSSAGDLLDDAARRSKRYLAGLDARSVAPVPSALDRLGEFDHSLPVEPTASEVVLAMLNDIGSAATVATAGSRFFGFVIGGSLPAAMAANWMTSSWDQNAGLYQTSPVSATLETVAERWLVDLLNLPEGTSASFVTGCTMANFTGLLAARQAVLEGAGWDAPEPGLRQVIPDRHRGSFRRHHAILPSLEVNGKWHTSIRDPHARAMIDECDNISPGRRRIRRRFSVELVRGSALIA